jgi:hypothetical protein
VSTALTIPREAAVEAADAAAVGAARTPADRLRYRLLTALRSGGFPVEPAAVRRRIRDGLTAARPIAADLVEVLGAAAAPESDVDLAVLAAVPGMAAFGRLATGYAYARVAARPARDAEVARVVAAFIVASALFDHACDREPELVRAMTATFPPGWLSAAFHGRLAGRACARITDPVPVKYVAALCGYAARLWRDLTAAGATAPRGVHRAALWSRLVEVHEAQVATTRVAGPRDVRLIWSAPLVVALYAVALTPGADPVDVGPLLPEAERIGVLLSLVDDLDDLAEDWRWGSANQYLDGQTVVTRPGSAAAGTPVPWEALLAGEPLDPYLRRIVDLVGSLPASERDPLIPWLLY